jgi:tetratricopeptide (TPR) repeat protein
MLKNVLTVSGLLISSSLCLSAKAATINTSGKDSQRLLIAQLPHAQRLLQERQMRIGNYLIYQEGEKKKRENAEIARQQTDIEKQRQIKQWRDAIPVLERKRNYIKLYEVFTLLGERQKSLIAAEKAVEANPNSALAYTYRGITRRRLKNVQGALADFNRVIELDQSSHVYYQNRGWLKKSFDKNGAIQDYFMALKVAKNNPTVSNRKSVYFEIINELFSLGVQEKEIHLALKYFDIDLANS